MINSKPYHICLPNPLSLSSLSSLMLWSACNNRPVSRSASSSDPLNNLLLLCPPGLLCWQCPEHSSLCAPTMCTLFLLSHRFLSSLSHFPTCLRGWVNWSPVCSFSRFPYAFHPLSLYTGIYFINDKTSPDTELKLSLYMQLQRYLLFPLGSISPATSVFSVFLLTAFHVSVATCP